MTALQKRTTRAAIGAYKVGRNAFIFRSYIIYHLLYQTRTQLASLSKAQLSPKSDNFGLKPRLQTREGKERNFRQKLSWG
ncbi:hypothetical protein K2173_002935 [Erythroxylum novogranatense]|uniref:Ribosomal protein L20 n=1 Tax=Erythroxylum novogranatense TaxID=1862640 RepID=A0AAV8TT76_9ROSI|nr:hypothetical protein K2173_002935 [Erythroxylum novogranatense]